MRSSILVLFFLSATLAAPRQFFVLKNGIPLAQMKSQLSQQRFIPVIIQLSSKSEGSPTLLATAVDDATHSSAASTNKEITVQLPNVANILKNEDKPSKLVGASETLDAAQDENLITDIQQDQNSLLTTEELGANLNDNLHKKTEEVTAELTPIKVRTPVDMVLDEVFRSQSLKEETNLTEQDNENGEVLVTTTEKVETEEIVELPEDATANIQSEQSIILDVKPSEETAVLVEQVASEQEVLTEEVTTVGTLEQDSPQQEQEETESDKKEKTDDVQIVTEFDKEENSLGQENLEETRATETPVTVIVRAAAPEQETLSTVQGIEEVTISDLEIQEAVGPEVRDADVSIQKTSETSPADHVSRFSEKDTEETTDKEQVTQEIVNLEQKTQDVNVQNHESQEVAALAHETEAVAAVDQRIQEAESPQQEAQEVEVPETDKTAFISQENTEVMTDIKKEITAHKKSENEVSETTNESIGKSLLQTPGKDESNKIIKDEQVKKNSADKATDLLAAVEQTMQERAEDDKTESEVHAQQEDDTIITAQDEQIKQQAPEAAVSLNIENGRVTETIGISNKHVEQHEEITFAHDSSKQNITEQQEVEVITESSDAATDTSATANEETEQLQEVIEETFIEDVELATGIPLQSNIVTQGTETQEPVQERTAEVSLVKDLTIKEVQSPEVIVEATNEAEKQEQTTVIPVEITGDKEQMQEFNLFILESTPTNEAATEDAPETVSEKETTTEDASNQEEFHEKAEQIILHNSQDISKAQIPETKLEITVDELSLKDDLAGETISVEPKEVQEQKIINDDISFGAGVHDVSEVTTTEAADVVAEKVITEKAQDQETKTDVPDPATEEQTQKPTADEEEPVQDLTFNEVLQETSPQTIPEETAEHNIQQEIPFDEDKPEQKSTDIKEENIIVQEKLGKVLLQDSPVQELAEEALPVRVTANNVQETETTIVQEEETDDHEQQAITGETPVQELIVAETPQEADVIIQEAITDQTEKVEETKADEEQTHVVVETAQQESLIIQETPTANVHEASAQDTLDKEVVQQIQETKVKQEHISKDITGKEAADDQVHEITAEETLDQDALEESTTKAIDKEATQEMTVLQKASAKEAEQPAEDIITHEIAVEAKTLDDHLQHIAGEETPVQETVAAETLQETVVIPEVPTQVQETKAEEVVQVVADNTQQDQTAVQDTPSVDALEALVQEGDNEAPLEKTELHEAIVKQDEQPAEDITALQLADDKVLQENHLQQTVAKGTPVQESVVVVTPQEAVAIQEPLEEKTEVQEPKAEDSVRVSAEESQQEEQQHSDVTAQQVAAEKVPQEVQLQKNVAEETPVQETIAVVTPQEAVVIQEVPEEQTVQAQEMKAEEKSVQAVAEVVQQKETVLLDAPAVEDTPSASVQEAVDLASMQESNQKLQPLTLKQEDINSQQTVAENVPQDVQLRQTVAEDVQEAVFVKVPEDTVLLPESPEDKTEQIQEDKVEEKPVNVDFEVAPKEVTTDHDKPTVQTAEVAIQEAEGTTAEKVSHEDELQHVVIKDSPVQETILAEAPQEPVVIQETPEQKEQIQEKKSAGEPVQVVDDTVPQDVTDIGTKDVQETPFTPVPSAPQISKATVDEVAVDEAATDHVSEKQDTSVDVPLAESTFKITLKKETVAEVPVTQEQKTVAAVADQAEEVVKFTGDSKTEEQPEAQATIIEKSLTQRVRSQEPSGLTLNTKESDVNSITPDPEVGKLEKVPEVTKLAKDPVVALIQTQSKHAADSQVLLHKEPVTDNLITKSKVQPSPFFRFHMVNAGPAVQQHFGLKKTHQIKMLEPHPYFHNGVVVDPRTLVHPRYNKFFYSNDAPEIVDAKVKFFQIQGNLFPK